MGCRGQGTKYYEVEAHDEGQTRQPHTESSDGHFVEQEKKKEEKKKEVVAMDEHVLGGKRMPVSDRVW